MRRKDQNLARRLDRKLQNFGQQDIPLVGLESRIRRKVFVRQIIESTRRVIYPSVLMQRPISEQRADPTSAIFDPLRAAILSQRKGNIEEAFWLVFLFVHFGKAKNSGWQLVKDVYGGLGQVTWDWTQVRVNTKAFGIWLATNEETLRGSDGVSRGFGNHRKYESLSATSKNGTASVIESYVKWVTAAGTHQTLIAEAAKECDGDPKRMFRFLYGSMGAVRRFGRTARFDYLAMIGKLGLAPIQPDAAYMSGATGPVEGARLLFTGTTHSTLTPRELEARLAILEPRLGIGMQAMEDALCNWQKSPELFIGFRG